MQRLPSQLRRMEVVQPVMAALNIGLLNKLNKRQPEINSVFGGGIKSGKGILGIKNLPRMR